MNVTNNRTVGAAQITIGLFWLAALPVFLGFMVLMETSSVPQPDSATWRLWRALETLLVEPRWLGAMLSVLVLGASLIGIVLVTAGIGVFLEKAQGQKWGTLAAVCGIVFCGAGFLFHWALLVPVVNASQHPEVRRASDDLNLAIPVVLAAGLASMIAAILVPLGSRLQRGRTGKLSTAT
jgi:hypothetical protein